MDPCVILGSCGPCHGARRSHCPGGQALFVHASQSLGGRVDHLPARHACEGQVPVCAANIGHASPEPPRPSPADRTSAGYSLVESAPAPAGEERTSHSSVLV